MTVSAASIAGMWVYIGAVIVAIVAVFWIFGHRVEMNLSTMILGAIVYFVFDAVLLNMFFDQIVVGTFSQGMYATITTNPSVFVPYYAITRGIFYALGFYIASRMSMRADTSGGGFALGIGFMAGFGIMNRTHGAWTVFQAFRAALAINGEGGMDGYLAMAQAEGADAERLESLRESVEQLIGTDISYYLVSALEVLFIMAILFSVAIVIHLAVTHRSPYMWLIIGIVISVIVMLPTALSLATFIGRVVYMVLLAVCVAGTVALAAVLAKRYMHNQAEQW